MSLGKKVLSSAILLFIRKIWSNVINLVVMAFLARMLSKEDFGLLAVSSVLLSIINSLATSGIAEYVIYYKGDREREVINAAFWLNLILTIAVVLIAVSVGPFWSSFYENDKIFSLILLLLVSFFFEMSSTIPRSLLRKELEYKTLVFYGTVSMTIISIGKLVAAYFGMGVYSLTIPQAIVSPLLMIALFVKTGWYPLGTLGISYFKPIFKYSSNLIGGRVLTRIVNEGDNLIVGKFVGLEGLGVYSLAYNLANLVTTNVIFIANDIFLPLFSKVKGDVIRLKEIYTNMINVLASFSFPLISTLAIFAEPLVSLIYGEKWEGVVLPFQILCVFAVGRSLSSPSSALFSAMGRPDINFKVALIFTPLFLFAVYLGSYFEVVGVAVATTIARLLGSIVSLSLSLNLIALRLSDMYNLIRRNFVVAALFTLIVFVVYLYLDVENTVFTLLIFIPFVIYGQYIIQRFLFEKDFIEFISRIKNLVGSRFPLKLIDQMFFIKVRHDR